MSLSGMLEGRRVRSNNAVNQTLYESSTEPPSLSPLAFSNVNRELQSMHFAPVAASPNAVTFRDGERFVRFDLTGFNITVRLGVGSHEDMDFAINSMRLDEMIAFLYGGMKRGCQAVDERGLQLCLEAALSDLKEFAHEFLRGDFRPFLRVLAAKKREERELDKMREAASKVFLA